MLEGVLCGTKPSETARLHLAIADPFNNGGRNEIAISRDADRAPLSLTVIPLRHHVEWIARQEQAAIVFVSDPEEVVCQRHQVLQKQFGLTRAEAALVDEMLKGGDMPEVAARLGNSAGDGAHAPASHLQRRRARHASRSWCIWRCRRAEETTARTVRSA